MERKIDKIDLRILKFMQEDGSLSTAEIAERTGLSQSPCWRRIQRLKKEGYIKCIVAIIDRHKLGLNMQIFAQIKMGTLTDAQREKFLRTVKEMPEIQECYSLVWRNGRDPESIVARCELVSGIRVQHDHEAAQRKGRAIADDAFRNQMHNRSSTHI